MHLEQSARQRGPDDVCDRYAEEENADGASAVLLREPVRNVQDDARVEACFSDT